MGLELVPQGTSGHLDDEDSGFRIAMQVEDIMGECFPAGLVSQTDRAISTGRCRIVEHNPANEDVAQTSLAVYG